MKGRGLFERNATACENATHPHCVCACGGALHGSAHSAEWRASTWGALVAAALKDVADADQLPLDVHAAKLNDI
jgi:hypothetical protein